MSSYRVVARDQDNHVRDVSGPMDWVTAVRCCEEHAHDGRLMTVEINDRELHAIAFEFGRLAIESLGACACNRCDALRDLIRHTVMAEQPVPKAVLVAICDSGQVNDWTSCLNDDAPELPTLSPNDNEAIATMLSQENIDDDTEDEECDGK